MSGSVDFVFKVLVLGDSSVGKSSLIRRLHADVFDQKLPTTIGVDFFIHDFEVEGKKVKVCVSTESRMCKVRHFALGNTRYTRAESLRHRVLIILIVSSCH